MKKILFFAVLASILVYCASASFAFAADLNIDCPAPPMDCIKTGTDPLFSIANDGYWYPGRTLTKTINLKNSSPEKREMAIKGERTSGQNILEEKMHISVVGGTTVIWSGSVADFYNEEKIGMGIFDSADLDYDFTVSMDLSVGDKYQNLQTVFDLTLGFWGEPVPTPTPPPVPGLGPLGAAAPGPAAPPVCTDTKPGIPTGFTAVAGPGVGQVILSWTPPEPPYTYFLVAYSDSSSWPPKWGNPNIGDVTTFTVSGLGSGSYWFWLRAGNGCMPGDFVGPITPGVITGLPGAPPFAPGFLPEVLGEATPSAEITPTLEVGEVAGAEVEKAWPWWWILLLLALAISTSGYYWLKKKES